MQLPLAVTLGEPAGIGPDITLTAWQRRHALALPPFYVLGDPDFLTRRAGRLGLRVPVAAADPDNATTLFRTALPVVPIDIAITTQPGHPDPSSAPAAIASIDRAVSDVLKGRAAAIVTNPIAKSVLYQNGFSEPGHTEYLARLSQQALGKPFRAVMMLWSHELAVVPVTIHIPLRDVPAQLSYDLIIETAEITVRDLKSRFGIARPRLAFAGLNPHAGENGTIGEEDRDIVAPAIEELRARGIDARGPLPADTMFHLAARSTYDAALCMYHDQALIPIKTLAFDQAVNVTLGLPFIRTSPDHGTAFDIAGSGRADASSLIAAIRLASRLAASSAKTRDVAQLR
ncbi:MAG TPA: 4-hydroxythreonine-4-phosphate dehydrogenase PdxA [Xanthobacteraceae bacterium]|nr:4-hydroxythreonine-4-phosphate dehydrogenase PdxA [Xanthobacteraceae bacterium]